MNGPTNYVIGRDVQEEEEDEEQQLLPPRGGDRDRSDDAADVAYAEEKESRNRWKMTDESATPIIETCLSLPIGGDEEDGALGIEVSQRGRSDRSVLRLK